MSTTYKYAIYQDVSDTGRELYCVVREIWVDGARHTYETISRHLYYNDAYCALVMAESPSPTEGYCLMNVSENYGDHVPATPEDIYHLCTVESWPTPELVMRMTEDDDGNEIREYFDTKTQEVILRDEPTDINRKH